MKSKQVSTTDAVALVHDDVVVHCDGFEILGPAIHACGLSARIYETREEAEAAL